MVRQGLWERRSASFFVWLCSFWFHLYCTETNHHTHIPQIFRNGWLQDLGCMPHPSKQWSLMWCWDFYSSYITPPNTFTMLGCSLFFRAWLWGPFQYTSLMKTRTSILSLRLWHPWNIRRDYRHDCFQTIQNSATNGQCFLSPRRCAWKIIEN